jgi:hypothetical protein
VPLDTTPMAHAGFDFLVQICVPVFLGGLVLSGFSRCLDDWSDTVHH